MSHDQHHDSKSSSQQLFGGAALMIAALSLATASACQPPRKLTPTDFPANIAPPFGLDRIEGGLPRDRALAILDARTTGSWKPAGVTTSVLFDGDRTGDIEIQFDDCTGVARLLTERWGVSKHSEAPLRTDDIWVGTSTGWIASLRSSGSSESCYLTFTSSTFFGATVGPSGALREVHPGMTKQAAARVAPRIADATSMVPMPGIVDGQVGVVYDESGRVSSTQMNLPPSAVLALAAAWGPGTRLEHRGAHTVWIDPQAGIRATLREDIPDYSSSVTFDTYVPAARWFGEGDAIAALPSPVLGATLDEVKNAYPDAFAITSAGYALRLPATEWSPEAYTQVSLRADATGRVTRLSILFAYDRPATRDALLTIFEKKWGPRQPASSGSDFHDASGGALHVRDADGWLGLELQTAGS